MSNRPVAAILTLGCKLNLADSEQIARALRAVGFETVDRPCEADAYVVNTCSVTHVADQKSRRLIRSVRRLSPSAVVAVTGCFPQGAGVEPVRELGADLVVGTRDHDKAELVAFLTGVAASRAKGAVAPPSRRRGLHTRAFIKAQEGCHDVCAFCIVPRTRGREESRPIADVLAELRRAEEAGAREAVITGTQLGAWGRDLAPALRPHHLISAILEATRISRIRFSSLQPQDISPELLALWEDPRLMPHFHLALQSGSDAVLTAMRRRYNATDFRMAADRIRAAVPDAAITTDVIAAFPGETEEDFEQTLQLGRDVRFARLHCFPYSPRTKTAAARMPGQVPAPVRQARMASLLALGQELSEAFQAQFAGAVRPVLWEQERPIDGVSAWFGHTDNYIPVLMPGEALHNRITPVRLGAMNADAMRGEPVGVAP
jgi:threonylcarbamoyladenosine tRNA methylthiotransferase MtaB